MKFFAALLVSSSVTSAAIAMEPKEWEWQEDGAIKIPHGVVKPWNQDTHLRNARKQSKEAVDALLERSVKRVRKVGSEILLELHLPMKGGMKRWDGQQSAYPCNQAPETDRYCIVKGGSLTAPDSQWDGPNPGAFSIVENSNYNPYAGGGSKGGGASSKGYTYHSGIGGRPPQDFSWLNAPSIAKSMTSYVHKEPPYGFGLTEQERIQQSDRESKDALARGKAIMESTTVH